MMTENDQLEPHGNSIMEQLTPILRDRALLCAAERSVPPELPALVSVAAVAACLGKGLVVQSGPSRQTRANLFILMGAPSGVGKSEVFRDLLGPLMTFEQELHQWWSREAAPRARAGDELLKIKISSVRSTVKIAHRPDIKCFREIQEAEAKRAVCRRYLEPPSLVADDATPEALGQIMARSNESVAAISADARHLLKKLAVSNGKEEAFFLKTYSGDLTLTSRISRRAARLRSPCLTTILLTQHDAYAAFLNKARMTRSGLLPRFLHIMLKSSGVQPVRIDRRRAPSIRSNYAQLLGSLIENFQFEEVPAIVEPSKEALTFMARLESQCRQNAERDETITGEIMRRRAEQTWRIALCLHAAQFGVQAEYNPMEKVTVEAALKIVDATT